MPSRLRKEIRQGRPFSSREEEAFLTLQRTANAHFQALSSFLRSFEVTPTQYNVLRILRGAHPDSLPCHEVGDRMVTTVPDVTRLLDRLETRGLVARSRDTEDRRVVRAAVTERGLRLLVSIDQPLAAWLEELLAHLGGRRLQELVRLLDEARDRC